jgi:hypothetical protein
MGVCYQDVVQLQVQVNNAMRIPAGVVCEDVGSNGSFPCFQCSRLQRQKTCQRLANANAAARDSRTLFDLQVMEALQYVVGQQDGVDASIGAAKPIMSGNPHNARGIRPDCVRKRGPSLPTTQRSKHADCASSSRHAPSELAFARTRRTRQQRELLTARTGCPMSCRAAPCAARDSPQTAPG